MLLSGGNMWLKGSILNEYSTVAAGGNLSFNTHTVKAGITPTLNELNTNGFTQTSRVLITEERRVGTKGSWVWGVTGGHAGFCDYHSCWKYDYGWVSVPVSYVNTVTTIADPVSASASFTAGGDISIIATSLNNLNKGDSSKTLGVINIAPPPTDNSTPTLNITLPKSGLYKYNTSVGAPREPQQFAGGRRASRF